jgi:hypothetical protein
MDAHNRAAYTQFFIDLLPVDGRGIGNTTLRDQLRRRIEPADTLTDEDYWTLRNGLLDDGRIEMGRGRGGSVRLVVAPVEEAALPDLRQPVQVIERPLYEPFQNAIITGYAKENRLKRFVSEITASQGRRNTGGKWTRPDVTLIAVRSYTFIPGKHLEVISFEVKPSLDTALEGVFEALAHSVFAHRSYLAVDISAFAEEDDIPDQRIIQETSRLGVGYITFTDVTDYSTYEIATTAKLREPDPFEVDQFIKTQISLEKQEELMEWIR